MLRRFRADFHIHTCLSPCAELDLYPRRIVERAREAGLDMIAVTDHNAAANAGAVIRAAAGTGLTVFPGLEISSEEDVHILGVFETMEAMGPLLEAVSGLGAAAGSATDFSQDQVLVDEHDEVTGFHPAFLSGSVPLPVFEIVELIRAGSGLAIAAHFDRPAFGLVSQLGFVPPGLRLDALETFGQTPAAGEMRASPLPRLAFSDAHAAREIGRRSTDFWLAAPSLAEIRLALAGQAGRRILEP